MATTTPRTIAALDVPAEQVAAEARALDDCRVLRDAMAATHSPSDRIAYAYDQWLVTHPEACPTAADYPGWTPGRTA
ncbi:hypothetical protein ACWY4P_40520 [Streptomyces sp. LZ34]